MRAIIYYTVVCSQIQRYGRATQYQFAAFNIEDVFTVRWSMCVCIISNYKRLRCILHTQTKTHIKCCLYNIKYIEYEGHEP